MRKHLNHLYLLSILEYDPATGIFRWRNWRQGIRKDRLAGMYCEKMQQGRVCIDGTYYSAHRLAWFYMVGEWPDGEIDHINGEKSDNRFANFRDVPRSINQQNIRKSIGPNSENRLLGTSYNKRTGRWIAKIALNKKQYGLGYFDTMEEAHEVYLAAKRKMHPGCTI